ncbi:MAG: DUF6378 domain-containing protein [Bacillota bacterium]|nr:DUF6378 domain-containing protein [Bacillota bacterium]
MKRAEILKTASDTVCTDREQQYGSPEDNFQTIADLWTAYIYGKGLSIHGTYGVPVKIKADDVAIMQALLKIGRIASGQTKDDNYVDGCGYLSCAGELASNGKSD